MDEGTPVEAVLVVTDAAVDVVGITLPWTMGVFHHFTSSSARLYCCWLRSSYYKHIVIIRHQHHDYECFRLNRSLSGDFSLDTDLAELYRDILCKMYGSTRYLIVYLTRRSADVFGCRRILDIWILVRVSDWTRPKSLRTFIVNTHLLLGVRFTGENYYE